jgi:hypothetical protein
MLNIPLMAVPSQRLQTKIDGKTYSLTLTQRTTGMFIDVYVDGVAVCLGVVCIDRAPITSLGFDGAFVFIDNTNSSANPEYSLLNDSVFLYYLTADELA